MSMSRYDSIAATNIQAVINENHTNRHALSRKTGIGYQTLNRKLDGGSLTIEQLEKIAGAFNLNPLELLKDAA